MNKNGKRNGVRHEPAASVIEKFGGVRKLARLLSLDPACVSKWQTHAKNGQGAHGLIPAKYHWTLIAMARDRSIPLTADDLIGRPS